MAMIRNDEGCVIGLGYVNHPTNATRVRVFRDSWDIWTVDGVDELGNYTESVWTFASWEDAISCVPEFVRTHLPHLIGG